MTQPSDDPHGTILLIDDEDGVRKLVTRLLERLGYEVISASNGQAGIDAFDAMESDFYAVLLDLNMPIMGGEETLLLLQEAGCKAPIFIMSGYDKKSLKADLPSTGYVAKPINVASLKAQLAECNSTR